jgi:hypothetical protein
MKKNRITYMILIKNFANDNKTWKKNKKSECKGKNAKSY